MNSISKSIFVLGAVAIVIATGIFLLFPKKNNPNGSILYPNQPLNTYTISNATTTSKAPFDQAQLAVRATLQAIIDQNPGDNTKLYETAVVGDYAIQAWAGDVAGGETVLKYDRNESKWKIVDAGGGAWTLESLIKFGGVPQDIAQQLLAKLGR